MKKLVVLALMIVCCVGLMAKETLFLKLDKVTVNPKLKVDGKIGEDGVYADANLAISWAPQTDGFSFELTNRSKTALVIQWEEVSFVNADNISSRVVHSSSGKVLTVEPEAKTDGTVVPLEHLALGKKGWSVEPIYADRLSDEEFEAIKNKDLIYKVVIPIRKNNIKTTYTFVFKAFVE